MKSYLRKRLRKYLGIIDSNSLDRRIATQFERMSKEASERTAKDRVARNEAKPYQVKAMENLLAYSQYAYGMYHAAILASQLGVERISAIEFGVAGGNGIVAMETHAREIELLTGVKIDTYGFDTGEGLTKSRDYRDMPYRFREGNYRMDVPRLQSRLKWSTLILGDIADTAPNFFETYSPAPIGFVSFDMDYYSSTMHCFRLFGPEIADHYFLPRMHMYFDDVVGGVDLSYSAFTGELAAISDFNQRHDDLKIAESRDPRKFGTTIAWYHSMYMMHRFAHHQYPIYVSDVGPEALALKD